MQGKWGVWKESKGKPEEAEPKIKLSENSTSIETIIQENQLKCLRHIIRMADKRIAKKRFEAREVGKEKDGRPRKMWKEEVIKTGEERWMKWWKRNYWPRRERNGRRDGRNLQLNSWLRLIHTSICKKYVFNL